MSQPWAALFPGKCCPKGCVCDTQGSGLVAGKDWSCQLLLAKLFSALDVSCGAAGWQAVPPNAVFQRWALSALPSLRLLRSISHLCWHWCTAVCPSHPPCALPVKAVTIPSTGSRGGSRGCWVAFPALRDQLEHQRQNSTLPICILHTLYEPSTHKSGNFVSKVLFIPLCDKWREA